MAKLVSVHLSNELEKSRLSVPKRKAILDAATEVFLKGGYLGTNMDEIAVLSAVSKQTVYKHFSSKEALFIEIVTSMTNDGSEAVLGEIPELEEGANLTEYLCNYANQQLKVVLTPRLMQLRRLVIGEVSRFPKLAKVLYEGGPKRAMEALATTFKRLADRGLLEINDSMVAASHFNWLVMSDPLNQVMLLGDEAIPTPKELRQYAIQGVRVFLAAYGKH
jgi:TetR/AcrR family transcriptional regulator, mexJK operon transcriptional repressor